VLKILGDWTIRPNVEHLVLSLLIACLMSILFMTPAIGQPSEDVEVIRLQLGLETATVDDAGTDDNVTVELNDLNRTRLNYGRDDFNRCDDWVYDLRLEGVHTLRDIKYLRIAKDGTNGWCIRRLVLYVNNDRIFGLTLENLAPCLSASDCAGLWLDNNGSHSREVLWGSSILRQHPNWRQYIPRALGSTYTMTRKELQDRIEAYVGGEFPSMLNWDHNGDPWVGVTKAKRRAHENLNPGQMDIDLDLESPLGQLGQPVLVDVDCALSFRCENNMIDVSVRSLSISGLQVSSTEAKRKREQIAQAIEDGFGFPRRLLVLSNDECCVSIRLPPEGGVRFSEEPCPTPPPPPEVVGCMGTDNCYAVRTGCTINQRSYCMHFRVCASNLADARIKVAEELNNRGWECVIGDSDIITCPNTRGCDYKSAVTCVGGCTGGCINPAPCTDTSTCFGLEGDCTNCTPEIIRCRK